ncbi:MAG TPA: glycosyltransferase [Bacillales bacterium]|nr:glycosyltransferase [Bacillales bacterium]
MAANLIFFLLLILIWGMLLYHMFLTHGGYAEAVRFRNTVQNKFFPIENYPKVSILIPAHNEEVVLQDTLEAMSKLKYPDGMLEIIVINDNSSDHTGTIAARYAAKNSQIKSVQTSPPFAGKGKSSALNYGLEHATGEIIVVYDADNVPDEMAVLRLAVTLKNDTGAGAVIGRFRVMNANRNLLTRFINIETICFQWMAQAGRWHWLKFATIPGTNFAIRRHLLDSLGGWDPGALTEDTELSIRVYNLGYYIRFLPNALTWEQEPETLGVWWRQRTRWARGNLYVVIKYLFKWRELKKKTILLDLFYFFFTYFMFLFGILASHGILVLNLFTDLHLKHGSIAFVLLIMAFLLFVTEVLLGLSIEKNELTAKNVLVVLFMYFTYSQLWILLVIYALILEVKRVCLQQEVHWDKTERYKTNQSA